MRAAFVLPATLVAVSPAWADCDHFKWSVARERTWFAASPAPLPASGGAADVGRAYQLSLARDVSLPVAPERAPKPQTYAAVVETPKLPAGLYQISLSAEAWLDVVQNGARVKSADFSGQHDCPGLRKSVRFQLSGGPATLEISGASQDRIVFAISAP